MHNLYLETLHPSASLSQIESACIRAMETLHHSASLSEFLYPSAGRGIPVSEAYLYQGDTSIPLPVEEFLYP